MLTAIAGPACPLSDLHCTLVKPLRITLQGNDERDTTLNQLLSEMDGFGDQGGPATSHPSPRVFFPILRQLLQQHLPGMPAVLPLWDKLSWPLSTCD